VKVLKRGFVYELLKVKCKTCVFLKPQDQECSMIVNLSGGHQCLNHLPHGWNSGS